MRSWAAESRPVRPLLRAKASRAKRRVQAKFPAESRKFSCRKAGSARLRIEKIGEPGKAKLFWGGRTDGGQGRHREAGRLRFSQNRAVSIKTVKLVRSNSAPVFCAMRRFRIWVGEPLGAPAGEDADREGALIRPLRGTSPLGERKARAGGPVCRPYRPHPPRFARHLPLKGKACGRLIAAPTG